MLKVILIFVLTSLQITTYGRAEEPISAPEQTNISKIVNSDINKQHEPQTLVDISKTQKGNNEQTNEDVTKNTQANIKQVSSDSDEKDVLLKQNNKSFQNDTRDIPTLHQKNNRTNSSDAKENEKDDLKLKNPESHNITVSSNCNNETTLNSDTNIDKNVKHENSEHETSKLVNTSSIAENKNGEEDVQNTNKDKENPNETTGEIKSKENELSINNSKNEHSPNQSNKSHRNNSSENPKLKQANHSIDYSNASTNGESDTKTQNPETRNISASNDYYANRMLNIDAETDKDLYGNIVDRIAQYKTPESARVSNTSKDINGESHIQHIAKSKKGSVEKKLTSNDHTIQRSSNQAKKSRRRNRKRKQSRLKQGNRHSKNRKASNTWKADLNNVTSDSNLNNSQPEDKDVDKSEQRDKVGLSNSTINETDHSSDNSKPSKLVNNNTNNDSPQYEINIQNKYLNIYEQYINKNYALVQRPIDTASQDDRSTENVQPHNSHHSNEKELNLTYNLKKGTRLKISLTFDILKNNAQRIDSTRNKNNYIENPKLKKKLKENDNFNKGVGDRNDNLKVGVNVKVTLLRDRPEYNSKYCNSSVSTHCDTNYTNAIRFTKYHNAENILTQIKSYNLNTVNRTPRANNQSTVKEFVHFEFFDEKYRSIRYKRALKNKNIYNDPPKPEQPRRNNEIAIPLHNLQRVSLIPHGYGNEDISNIANKPASQKFRNHKFYKSGQKAFMKYKFETPEFPNLLHRNCNECGYRNKLNRSSLNFKRFYPKSTNFQYLYSNPKIDRYNNLNIPGRPNQGQHKNNSSVQTGRNKLQITSLQLLKKKHLEKNNETS